MTEDERYMQVALQLAELGRGQTSPNPCVGAVIVKNGEIVGQGAHLKAGGPHAEVHALAMAGENANSATAYVTLEPCSHFGKTPPCADALIQAGVKRVVVATEDADQRVHGRGIRRLREAGIDVCVGVLGDEARRQNEAFFHRVCFNRPFVVWKCAATLDGYIAARTGHSQYVTGAAARQEVAYLRRKLDAVAVGIGTVLVDNPRLTVRITDGQGTSGASDASGASGTPTGSGALGTTGAITSRQPLRVVFDTHLRALPTCRMFHEPGENVVYCTEEALHSDKAGAWLEAADETCTHVVPIPVGSDGHVAIPAALEDLAMRGVNSMLLEGGSALASSFFKHQLVDKVVYYVAPKLLGGGIPALWGADFARMTQAVSLTDVTVQQVGSDFRLEGYPVYSETAVE